MVGQQYSESILGGIIGRIDGHLKDLSLPFLALLRWEIPAIGILLWVILDISGHDSFLLSVLLH